MPVLTEFRQRFSVEDITSSWGVRRARLASSRMTALLSSLLEQIDRHNWLQPKISFQVHAVIVGTREQLTLRGGSTLSSPMLGHYLPVATHVAAGVCTIGDAIENEVRRGFAASDRLRATILDEIGTLALYRLSDRVQEMIQEEAARMGLQASGALNPGEDGIPISQQETVLELASGADIGISQTSTGMLSPRKSLSMILGLGKQMRRWSRGERCAVCAARDRCPHRRTRLLGGAP
jgi:hypothetical protein